MNLSTFSGLITSCTCSTKLIFSPEVYQERRVILLYFAPFAPVAQLDRVPGYEPGGRGFKSCRARQTNEGVAMLRPLLHFRPVTDLCHHRQLPQPAERIADPRTGPDVRPRDVRNARPSP